MLRTCVKAGKARLLLPEITRRCLEVAIDEDDLFVYKGTLQVGHGHLELPPHIYACKVTLPNL